MPTAPTYGLLAIDLDGTLLDPDGRIAETDLDAIERARTSGMTVTICTGRGLRECAAYAQAINQRDPIVVASGAMLACPVENRTLHRFPMHPELTGRLVECFRGHGHAVLVLKDSDITGHDYLVIAPNGLDDVDPITRWWFEKTRVTIRCVASIDLDEHPEHSMRVAICGTRAGTTPAASDMHRHFASEAAFHHFGAVVPGSGKDDPGTEIVILEAFDGAVNKWSAIEFLTKSMGLCSKNVAVIGNDVNDLVMLECAALGVAMGNSIPEAIDAADRITLDNTSGGVAHAIDRILGGHW